MVPALGGVKAGLSGEQFLLDVLEHFLPKVHGAFVDVGANIGQTLCKVKLADPARAYYGFEPNASCHTYLEELVRINRWRSVHLFPCGLGDRAVILPMHVRDDRATDSKGSILPDARPELDLARKKMACFFAFDDIADVIDEAIAFVKIDVEGAELEAVRGFVESLRRDQPVVVIELMPVESLRERHAQTIELLQSLGYDVFVIDKNECNEWSGCRPVPSVETGGEESASDYLAIPHAKVSMLDR